MSAGAVTLYGITHPAAGGAVDLVPAGFREGRTAMLPIADFFSKIAQINPPLGNG
jgi:hypothetical protein